MKELGVHYSILVQLEPNQHLFNAIMIKTGQNRTSFPGRHITKFISVQVLIKCPPVEKQNGHTQHDINEVHISHF